MRRTSGIVGLLVFATACAAGAPPGDGARTTRERIVGGTPSSAAQDATVMLVMNGQFGCTGTLVAPNLVLTARHCVATSVDETGECGPAQGDMAASTFSIALGADAKETNAIGHGVKLYVPSTTNLCGKDVALIQLDADVPGVTPARVRFDKLAAGEDAVAVGYGSATPSGPPTAERMQRATTVEAVGPATKTWTTKSGTKIAYDVSDGDVATGESTCFGDSGGPLFDADGRIVAVTSRGIDDECADRPSVYTSVAANETLIRDAAKAAGHPLPDAAPKSEPAPQEPAQPDTSDTPDQDEAPPPPRRQAAAVSDTSHGCAASPTAPGRGASSIALLLLMTALIAAGLRARA